jgi:hypothetical protein
MRRAKLSTLFANFSDANLEQKAKLVIVSMTGNANFGSPVPTLAELQAALDQYSADLTAASTLGRINVANKNASRAKLEALMTQLAMYVMYVAMGDEAILTSSGFSLTKTPEARYITNPGNVTLSNGITSGQMTGSVKTVPGSNGYLHQICTELPTPETVWTSYPSTRRQFTFTGLLAGKQYWVRVAATGANEQIAYSPVASQFAQ